MTDDRTIDRTIESDLAIVVASGPTLSRTIQGALAQLPGASILPGAGKIEILAPNRVRHPGLKSATAVLRQELAARNLGSEVAIRFGDRALKADPPGWIDLATPNGARRFEQVRVPAWLRVSDRRCLVTAVSRGASRSSLRPLSHLAGLAIPRQRLAARLNQGHSALAAELASPWKIKLLVLVATRQSRRVVVVTRDLIAAELAWLALAADDSDESAIGPWEDPAVQRATQLDLGISGPHQLRLVFDNATVDPVLVRQLSTALGIFA